MVENVGEIGELKREDDFHRYHLVTNAEHEKSQANVREDFEDEGLRFEDFGVFSDYERSGFRNGPEGPCHILTDDHRLIEGEGQRAILPLEVFPIVH